MPGKPVQEEKEELGRYNHIFQGKPEDKTPLPF